MLNTLSFKPFPTLMMLYLGLLGACKTHPDQALESEAKDAQTEGQLEQSRINAADGVLKKAQILVSPLNIGTFTGILVQAHSGGGVYFYRICKAHSDQKCLAGEFALAGQLLVALESGEYEISVAPCLRPELTESPICADMSLVHYRHINKNKDKSLASDIENIAAISKEIKAYGPILYQLFVNYQKGRDPSDSSDVFDQMVAERLFAGESALTTGINSPQYHAYADSLAGTKKSAKTDVTEEKIDNLIEEQIKALKAKLQKDYPTDKIAKGPSPLAILLLFSGGTLFLSGVTVAIISYMYQKSVEGTVEQISQALSDYEPDDIAQKLVEYQKNFDKFWNDFIKDNKWSEDASRDFVNMIRSNFMEALYTKMGSERVLEKKEVIRHNKKGHKSMRKAWINSGGKEIKIRSDDNRWWYIAGDESKEMFVHSSDSGVYIKGENFLEIKDRLTTEEYASLDKRLLTFYKEGDDGWEIGDESYGEIIEHNGTKYAMLSPQTENIIPNLTEKTIRSLYYYYSNNYDDWYKRYPLLGEKDGQTILYEPDEKWKKVGVNSFGNGDLGGSITFDEPSEQAFDSKEPFEKTTIRRGQVQIKDFPKSYVEEMVGGVKGWLVGKAVVIPEKRASWMLKFDMLMMTALDQRKLLFDRHARLTKGLLDRRLKALKNRFQEFKRSRPVSPEIKDADVDFKSAYKLFRAELESFKDYVGKHSRDTRDKGYMIGGTMAMAGISALVGSIRSFNLAEDGKREQLLTQLEAVSFELVKLHNKRLKILRDINSHLRKKKLRPTDGQWIYLL